MPGVASGVDAGFNWAVSLERYSANTYQMVNWHLTELEDELRRLILEADVPGQPASRQVRRLNAVLKQVEETTRQTYTDIGGTNQGRLNELPVLTEQASTRIINAQITVNIATPTLTAGELRVLAQDPMVQGLTTSDWWTRQDANTRQRFTTQMRMGIAAGETNDQLVRRVIGTAGKRTVTVNPETGKRSVRVQYEGGIMSASRREAEALVRTSAQTVSNKTSEDTYFANKHLLRGVGALVTLDHRTTLICIARSGGVWDMDTSDALPESTVSEPYPGPPPWHWNCRTKLMPITKSWDELRHARGKDRLPVKDRRKLDTVPVKRRDKIDGKVPPFMTYENWLKTQPAKRQQEILGPGRWKLWSDGKITPAQLIDFSGNPLTLKELKEIAARV